MRARRLALGAVAAAAVVLLGCAGPDESGAESWRVEPLARVTHGGPVDAAGYFALGEALRGEGRFDAAADAYRKAVAEDASHHRAWHALGIVLAALQKIEPSIVAFRRASELHPDAQYLNNLGYAQLLAGRPQMALVPLMSALAYAPDHERARQNLAHAYRALRHDTEPLAIAPRPGTVPDAEAAPLAVLAPSAVPLVIVSAVDPPATSTATAVDAAAPGAAPSAPAPDLAGIAVEVGNGNGVRGAARRVRDWLAGRGVPVGRLFNLRPFASPRTVVQYQRGFEAEASAVARRLPPGVAVEPADALRADLRIVVGHDVRTAADCTGGVWPCEAAGPTQLAAAPR